jgi:hypothetical protein
LRIPESKSTTIIVAILIIILVDLVSLSYASSNNLVPAIVYNFPDDGRDVSALLPAVSNLQEQPSSSVVIMDGGIYDAVHPDVSLLEYPGWNYFFEYVQVFSHHKVIAFTNDTKDISANATGYRDVILVITPLPSTAHYVWLAPLLQRLGITVTASGIMSPYPYQVYYSNRIYEIVIPQMDFLSALGPST